MKRAMPILLVGTVEIALAAWLGAPWIALLGWMAAVTVMVGASIAVRWTGLFLKNANGDMPWWVPIAFWPWLLTLRGILLLRRKVGSEPLFSEIHPGWFLGGWPYDPKVFERWPAVIDVTCELPRRRPEGPYLCLPTWDGTAPPVEDIERAVRWALAQRKQGYEILVHCAAGHSRSATVLAACLVAAHLHRDWKEAVVHMEGLRRGVHLIPEQEEVLTRWAARR